MMYRNLLIVVMVVTASSRKLRWYGSYGVGKWRSEPNALQWRSEPIDYSNNWDTQFEDSVGDDWDVSADGIVEERIMLDDEREVPLSAAVGSSPGSTTTSTTKSVVAVQQPSRQYNLVGDFDPCRITEKKDGNFLVLKSPKKNAGNCSLSFTSEAPGFIRGKVDKASLGATDSFTYKGIFGDIHTITNFTEGRKFVLPSTFGTVEYSSTVEKKGVAFVVGAGPRTNNCQKVITAPAGSRGRLTVPGFDARKQYRPGTMCQWWITAPEGKKITLHFNAFDFGDAVAECAYTDYIGVDKSGDKTFQSASARKICGNTIPADIVSDANKIDVVANGARGGVGFCLNYIVDA